jgi:hypothetical protein
MDANRFNNLLFMMAQEGGDAADASIAMLRRVLARTPRDLNWRMKLANLLFLRGESDEAFELMTPVTQQSNPPWGAWENMGMIRSVRGELGEAIQCFELAHKLQPHRMSEFRLASAYLRAGDFARGLPLYAHYYDSVKPMPLTAPTWTGEKTGHLAVWGDRGCGDRIMYARFLPWAKERANKITFLTDPDTVPLLSGYSGVAEVRSAYPTDWKFDHQISVVSLALLYDLTPNNIPADPGLVTASTFAGSLHSDGLKIGIAWNGNPGPTNEWRSVPFRELLPLAADPRNTIYSLQCGPPAADIARAHAQHLVRDMSVHIEGEWSHTAALIKHLDLVVSSCTGIAHLAGALRVKTFLMLAAYADWRWLYGRDDTPWYPHIRLFRQRKLCEWKDVVTQIVGAISQLNGIRSAPPASERAFVHA